MRILMVLDHAFPPDTRVENEIASLTSAGFEVGLLSIAPGKGPYESRYAGARIFRQHIPGGLRNKMRGTAGIAPFYEWYLMRSISRAYAQYRFHALHIHDLYLLGGGLRAGRRLGVPVVADLHENYVEALQHYAWSTRYPGRLFVNIPRWRRLEREWVSGADGVIVVIEEAAQRVERLGINPEKIVVVPNTVRLEAYRQIPIVEGLMADSNDRFTIAYTGGFDLHRGLKSAIDAMPSVLSEVPDALLLLVGAGRNMLDLQERVRSLGLGEVVRFTGWQPEEHLKSYIASADVCLIPHLKSGHTDATIPHKLFHYMFMRKPVVAADCTPIERIVGKAGCGLIYPSGDSEALADRIIGLARDPEKRQAMGERGRAAVESEFNWERTARRMIEMYVDLSERVVKPG